MSLRRGALLWLTVVQVLVCRASPNPGHNRRQFHAVARPERDSLDKRIETGPTDEFSPPETVSVQTSVATNGMIQILPNLSNETPHTTGIVETTLNDRQSLIPLITSSIETPTSLLEASATASQVKMPPPQKYVSRDIFAEPIDTSAPPANINIRNDHPVPRKGVASSHPIQTNKFYANFFLGDQTAPTYTHPYSLHWVAGKGPTGSYGLAISHIEASQRVYGGQKPNGAVAYYANPVGIQLLIFGATELGKDTVLTIDNTTQFSAHVRLKKDPEATPAVSFPVVQGMGFVTALYSGTVPTIQSGVYFKTVTRLTKDPKADVAKFKLILEDGSTWLMYAFRTNGDQLDLQVVNNGYAKATKPFYGSIQVSKDPGNCEAILDEASGIYPTDIKLTGTASGIEGSYSFDFGYAGHPLGSLLMFALPHHLESFDNTTRSAIVNIQLQTTTKGMAAGVLSSRWTMSENRLPVHMNFAPFDPDRGSLDKLSNEVKKVISNVAKQEVSQNMTAQANLDSMYFSGKALGKFAMILYVINDMLEDQNLAQTGLENLKEAFRIFVENKQQYPLVYERAWGGVVSTGSYTTGSDSTDFGNTYYNDHHFHYGYFVLAGAVIGYLDPEWIKTNKDFVNMMARDYANPSSSDKYFPQYRSFDWYHGHSWAHGLYASLDGKNQESSSEDVMSAYALKMWGQVSGDLNMAARADLQLAVLSRSLQNYYLLKSDNKNQPAVFIGNKVAGILFENKCDHTTYFGPNIEYIQGIHMLPLLPATTMARTKDFVREEWDTYFSNGRVDEIQGAWKGIIYGNLATLDPKSAWKFFFDSRLDWGLLDGGASLTWYLAYAAAMGGA